MPKKKKGQSVSPLRNPLASSSPSNHPSFAEQSCPPTMSNNNNGELLRSMCDMFPNLDPSLVEMVLAEYKQVELVMDYLLELSTSAKVDTPVKSADIVGFDMVASLLNSNSESSPFSGSLENAASSDSPNICVLETENSADICISNDLDSLLDEALNKYSLSNNSENIAGDICSELGDDIATSVAGNSDFPELLQNTVKFNEFARNVDFLEGVESNDPQTSNNKTILCETKQNSTSIYSCSVSQPAEDSPTDSNVIQGPGTEIPSFCPIKPELKVSEEEQRSKTNKEKHCYSSTETIHTLSYGPPKVSLPNGPAHQTPIWNPMAPSFHPTLCSQQRFFMPVALTQHQLSLAGNVNQGISLNPTTHSFVWNGNNFPSNAWSTNCVISTQLLPVPQPSVQTLKNNTVFVGKVLILLRGAPGSGKTTLARMLLQHNPMGIILSTDDYFYKHGQYHFDGNLIGEAHEWNQKRAQEAFNKNISPIIIDNTNMQGWEMKPYVSMAVKLKYKVTFREPDTWWKCKPKELERRNSHGVPKEKIKRMLENYERVSVNSVMNVSKGPEQKSKTPAIKENITNAESSSVLSRDKLNFVGDWPMAHTMGQRAPRSRSKVKANCKVNEPSATYHNERDRDQKQLECGPVEQDCKDAVVQTDTSKEMPGLDQRNKTDIPIIHLADHGCPLMENVELNEDGPQTAQNSCLVQCDPQGVTESLQSLHISNIKEVEIVECQISEKRTRQNKCNCRHCKLALNFTNTCTSPSQTEDILPSQLTVTLEEVNRDNSKYSQTEPQEFALMWRIEQKNYDLSNTCKILCGKSDRFKCNVVDECADPWKTIPYRVMQHKSTFVEEDELANISDEDNLNILARLFRSVSFDVLSDLFERCNKDIVWASNLLLDCGEKFYKDEDCQTEGYFNTKENRALGDCCHPVEVSADNINDTQLQTELSATCLDGKREPVNNCPIVAQSTFANVSVHPVTDLTNTESVKKSAEGNIITSLLTHTTDCDGQPAPMRCSSHIEMMMLKNTYTDIHKVASELEFNNAKEDLYELIVSDIDVQDALNDFEKVDNTKNKTESFSKECLKFDHLELSLPPELAFQLSELFGPVGIDLGSLTIEDCTVHIDLNLAEAIHKRWKESIMERQKQETLSYELLFQDISPSELDNLIQEEESQCFRNDFENSHTSSDGFPFLDQWRTHTPKVSLRQIMSEEIALQEQECQKKSSVRKNCATKLKEKQLFELFPNIEKKLLKDIFKENNYSLENAAQFISLILEADPVHNVIAFPPDKVNKKKLKQDKETIPEKLYQDCEDPEYDDFRAEAFLYRRKQQECYRKAAEAHIRGMKPVATYYAQQAYLYGQKMKEENHRAAVHIFQRANEFLLPENILDLHGLHVSEAMKHFRQVLEDKMEEYKKNGGNSYLSVITGRGNHSHGGVPRIKLAVIDYLKNNSFRFQEIRPGVLRITLKV
ncbi:hypothetical protein GDO86_000295 [Hymenochirus boettgeri]|uniref:NEDD4-binding protein 2 n=1 Tax=Hymenochirus boettgeri TaxID=247094 RepID=A0A8T2KAF6_9PIPI|nr:hypothetical protein GDO86_000295 [Hymenochirus boettgeri]